jgi:hypothetical protein
MQVMVFMETGLGIDQQFGSTVPLHDEMAVLPDGRAELALTGPLVTPHNL